MPEAELADAESGCPGTLTYGANRDEPLERAVEGDWGITEEPGVTADDFDDKLFTLKRLISWNKTKIKIVSIPKTILFPARTETSRRNCSCCVWSGWCCAIASWLRIRLWIAIGCYGFNWFR